MSDERALIARLEAAGPDEMIRLLLRPSASDEKTLRAHLGDERYRRLHSLALKGGGNRRAPEGRGNVVVIHGFMGSDLTSVDRAGVQEPLWARAFPIMQGHLARLRLNEGGWGEHDGNYEIRATGIMKRHYGELLLALAQGWNVRAFWFDWRKDLTIAADELRARISGWFPPAAPVHLVAHSMGGLVARTFIARHPGRWQTMWDAATGGRLGGRLIMLGTPNHGSFAAPRALTGLEGIVKKLALFDSRHQPADLLLILNSFVGLYQMLPSPLVMGRMEALYHADIWGELNVPQRHLDAARKHHDLLAGVVEPERMIFIAGHNQPTFGDIADLGDWQRLRQPDAYAVTAQGDGWVPHHFGLLHRDGAPIPAYYVEEGHGNLPSNGRVLAALDELLASGETRGLDAEPPAARGPREEDEATQRALREQHAAAERADEERLAATVGRRGTRGAAAGATPSSTAEERVVEEVLTRGFLTYPDAPPRGAAPRGAPAPARIAVALALDTIDGLRNVDGPIDAVAVGHYVGVKPQAAELALDRAISAALPGQPAAAAPADADLLLTQYSERGIIRGELGQPFFLNDPRAPERIIAVAGMGFPGRFGRPELIVLARELCWSLGRLGKRRLATVLIGSGNGNLTIHDAVAGWLRGVEQALHGSDEDAGRGVQRLTFIEHDPRKVEAIQDAILDQQRRLREQERLLIDFTPFDRAELARLHALGQELEREEWARKQQERGHGPEPAPTRITVELERRIYRFGAITQDASIPEREIPLDPALVLEANDELAGEVDPTVQFERGRFLERLLIPDDFRPHLLTDAPLVLVLDATTARIHWEMLAPSEVGAPAGPPADDGARGGRGREAAFDTRSFLGTSRGFTRQLRTQFAPPPEPPPPPRRLLRVLVIADPAEDAHLPGAEAEGAEVADLFERFNTVGDPRAGAPGADGREEARNRVEVVRLFGPYEATRTNVLRHLLLRPFDVVHFAGHCLYDPADPAASGWIFSGGGRLTAHELKRIDRVPKFVFSNACESGITPDRSERRSVDLAPSFAESFFARGVSNFVCTAWPVDDTAARVFALTLYSELLGLAYRPGDAVTRCGPSEPHPMHVAMRRAREAIVPLPAGARTWGAYQHYGNPFLRFFDPLGMGARRAAEHEAPVAPAPEGSSAGCEREEAAR